MQQGPVIGLTVFLIVSFLTVESDSHVLVDKVKRGMGQLGTVRGRRVASLISWDGCRFCWVPGFYLIYNFTHPCS